jgi:hypothetical protein
VRTTSTAANMVPSSASCLRSVMAISVAVPVPCTQQTENGFPARRRPASCVSPKRVTTPCGTVSHGGRQPRLRPCVRSRLSLEQGAHQSSHSKALPLHGRGGCVCTDSQPQWRTLLPSL